MKPGSLLSNVGWLGLAGFISKPVWFLFILYAARGLGAEAFGLYAFLLALSGFLTAFSELGLDLQITRVVSPSKKGVGVAVSTSGFLRIVATFFAFLVGMLLFQLFFRDAYPFEVFLPGLLIGLSQFLISHLRAIFRSLEVLRQEAFSLMLEKLLVPALTFPSLVYGGELFDFLRLHLLGTGVVLIAGGIQLRNAGLRGLQLPTMRMIKEMVRSSLPFALLNMIQMVYVRLGTLSLERFTGNLSEIGAFSTGVRLQEAFAMVPSTIMGAVYPILCRIKPSSSTMSELTELTSRVLLATSIPVGATLMLAPVDATLLLFGEAYREASTAIAVFGATIIISSQVFLFGSVVSATGLQPKVNRLLFFCFSFSLILYLSLRGLITAEIAAGLAALDQALLLGINAWTARDLIRWNQYGGISARAVLVPFLVVLVLYLSIVMPGDANAGMQLLGFLMRESETSLDKLLHIAMIFSANAAGMVLFGVVRWKDILRLQRLNRTLVESGR